MIGHGEQSMGGISTPTASARSSGRTGVLRAVANPDPWAMPPAHTCQPSDAPSSGSSHRDWIFTMYLESSWFAHLVLERTNYGIRLKALFTRTLMSTRRSRGRSSGSALLANT